MKRITKATENFGDKWVGVGLGIKFRFWHGALINEYCGVLLGQWSMSKRK